ncbi:hypothetical protein BpHYR1_028720 [Brachionus plicatilis]|uniref:Uncharacterized protein n=1 Tax=Brachionus plicatilis TaxID=10195 RepID=A0A3M7T5N5_BRAPC|nr:hypothetical protein BpHYR1_028720 [Brachionus plicatilis]
MDNKIKNLSTNQTYMIVHGQLSGKVKFMKSKSQILFEILTVTFHHFAFRPNLVASHGDNAEYLKLKIQKNRDNMIKNSWKTWFCDQTLITHFVEFFCVELHKAQLNALNLFSPTPDFI